MVNRWIEFYVITANFDRVRKLREITVFTEAETVVR